MEICPTFYLCSRGWVKAVFTEALGEEVEVELRKAIGRGDQCCEFFEAGVRGTGLAEQVRREGVTRTSIAERRES